MPRLRAFQFPLLAVALVWACSGSEDGLEGDRDLSLPPAESVAVLSDEPDADPQANEVQPTANQPPPRRQDPPQPEPEPQRPAPLSLAGGTTIEIVAADSINSKDHEVGHPVTATTQAAVFDGRGRLVIPAGAVVTGRITELDDGGEGIIVLTFDRIHFDGNSYPIQAVSDSVGYEMKKGGVSAGDAAKVAAGGVVGAIAGRVIGGDKKSTIVGGVAGAAAGAGVAVATKGSDLIVASGSYIRIILTGTFVPEAT